MCRSSVSKIGDAGREQHPFAPILLLDPFERFVFVMSTLEGPVR